MRAGQVDLADHRAAVARLQTLGDSEIAAHACRYFRTGRGEYGEGDRFLGIRMPVLRQLAKAGITLPLDELRLLLHSPWHEARLLAVLIMTLQYHRGSEGQCRALYRLYLASTAHINNWDIVDASAHLIVGPWLEQRSRQPLVKLAYSSSLWERRIAMMSTLHYIRHGDFDTTLDLAERLLADREDLIHKVTGWMLREVGNRDRGVEEAFLRRHYRVMPRTMLRYAIEKFPETLRLRYLDGHIG